ncbi:uncharacterized protein LOC116180270 [Photinus pyralis]|nr:uncharacterized protein LOC116180270 [Photinus pyralis]
MFSYGLLSLVYFNFSLICSILYEGWNESNGINDVIPTLGYLNVIPRTAIIRFHKLKLVKTLRMLDEVNICNSDRRRQFKAVIETYMKWVFQITCSLALSVVVVGTITWYFTRLTPLPFGIMPKWALNYSFTSCLIIQLITFPFIAHEYVMIDCLKVGILIQLQMHFKNLRLDILNLLSCCTEDGVDSWEYLQNEVKKVNIYWDTLKDICTKIEDVFNLCVFSTVINYSLYLCCTYLGMSHIPLYGAEFWLIIFYLFASSFMFVADCWFTQRVITESDQVASSCYDVDFVGTDLKFQKALMLMIGKAKRPVRFTIGKFAPFCIVTLVVIAKVSFSYVTFLENI